MGNLPVGIIFIIIGTILLIVIDRRKFYRRIEREEGEESNKSYTEAASRGFAEGTIIIISRLMIILGGVLVLFVLFDALCPGSCKW